MLNEDFRFTLAVIQKMNNFHIRYGVLSCVLASCLVYRSSIENRHGNVAVSVCGIFSIQKCLDSLRGQKTRTYSGGYSLVVTDPTTN